MIQEIKDVKIFPLSISIAFRTQQHKKNKWNNLIIVFQKTLLRYKINIYVDEDLLFSSNGYTLLGKILKMVRLIK